jgi:hypothetical protein
MQPSCLRQDRGGSPRSLQSLVALIGSAVQDLCGLDTGATDRMITFPSETTFARLMASLFLFTSPPALAASAETPETFVRRVYSLYRTFDDPGVPMDRTGGAAFYTTTLLDAFAKDVELAHGQIGAIDSDPICACQAYGPLRIRKVAIIGGAADTVKAQVNFVNSAYRETVVLTLSRTPAGWRIADVGNRAMKSVLAALRESNAHPIEPDKPKQN